MESIQQTLLQFFQVNQQLIRNNFDSNLDIEIQDINIQMKKKNLKNNLHIQEDKRQKQINNSNQLNNTKIRITYYNNIMIANKKEQQILYNKFKTEQKSSTLNQIKTDLISFGKIYFNSGVKIQFGKPVKLPLLKTKKQFIQKNADDYYSSRNNNQNKSQIYLRNDFKDDHISNKIFNTATIAKHQRSNSYITKLMEKENLKFSLKEKSLDTRRINLSQIQQDQFIQTVNQNQERAKILPKILRYKIFKEANQKIQRIKSQKNVLKTQTYQNLQRYKFGNLLGQGTYATVKMAKSDQNELVAIKTYQKCRITDQQKLENIRREIEILKKLNHPNIIRFIQIIQTNNSINIVTQLVENTSLLDYLKGTLVNKLEQSQAKLIFLQIIEAIQYLHSLNIIHRDIKLQNILITKQKQIKLIDFGFSIETSNKMNIFCGTPSYISPQIILKKGYYGKPSDVWACGILLYRMICGTFPFKALNEKTLYGKISKGFFRFPIDIPQRVQNLLNKMLAVDPNVRINVQQILKDQWLSNMQIQIK